MGAWLARARESLPWRAWERYGRARGAVLAGGIAYAAFFSLFPALAVGFTVFGVFVQRGSDLQQRVIDAVNDSVGTAVISPRAGEPGIVAIDTLVGNDTLSVAGALGLAGLLFTGLGWLDATREGVRAMFGQPPLEGNVVLIKLRDVATLVGLGLTILSSTVAGLGVSTATGAVLDSLGLGGSTLASLLLGLLSTLVVLAVDVAVFLLLFRVLAGLHLPRKDLLDGALFGAVALGLLKLAGGALLNGAADNAFLATAGVLLGLLVWLNLISRVTLVAAAWGASVAVERGHLTLDDVPPAPAASAPAGSATAEVTTRAADRVSVAAGVVLGAAAVIVARAGLKAVRTVDDAVAKLLSRRPSP